jgi:hypothetical protein
MVKNRIDLNDPALKATLHETGETNIQALVVGPQLTFDEKFITDKLTRFHLSHKPIVSKDGLTMYVREGTVTPQTEVSRFSKALR